MDLIYAALTTYNKLVFIVSSSLNELNEFPDIQHMIS